MTNRPQLILLVDDNPDDVELALSALKRADVTSEITVANDGEEALSMVFGETSSLRRPSLILMDINLPRMRGIEVLRQLRDSPLTRLIPVVMLTNSREDRDVEDSYRNGANSYIRKPVDFHEFVDVARELANYWLLRNEAPR